MAHRGRHLQGFLTGSFGRLTGGLAMVVAAAIVAFAAGGNGVLGGFGGLFGSGAQPALDVARATGVGAPAAIVASPTAAQRLAALQRAGSPNAGVRGHRRNAHRHAFRPRSTPHRSPTGRPQPSLPPTPPPPPQKGQTVSKAGDTAKQVTSQAPPQLQPVTDPANSTIDTVEQTCRGLPVCP